MNLLAWAKKKPGLRRASPETAEQKYERAIQDLQRLQAELEADPEAFLWKTETLADEDFAILGKMIQSYCSSDFNARRTINAIRKASFGLEHQNAGKLQDKQVYEKLQECIADLPSGELKDGLRNAAATIAMHQQRRHDFAHWLFRKVPNEPVYYFCTNDEREWANRTGNPIGPGEARYGLMSKPQLVEELQKLTGHNEHLARNAVILEASYDHLKVYYDGKKEEARKAGYEAAKTNTCKKNS